MAIKTKDSILVGYATNWKTRITAAPADWNLVAADATAISDVVTPYVTAYNTLLEARESNIRSADLTRNKDTAKEAMLPVLRMYYTQIQADTDVTDGNKELLGITVPKQRAAIGIPTQIPKVVFDKVIGFTVFMHIEGPDENEHRLPPGCQGVSIYTYIGATPSASEADWKYFGNITRHKLEIDFPADTPPGSTVWFRACYFNPRNMCGMSCDPISARLQFVNGWMNQAA